MIIRTSRRTFIRGTAAATITGPFLKILENRAEAQTAPVKRLVLFATPNGTPMSNFWGGQGVYGPILKNSGLEALKSKLLVMRGLDNSAGAEDPIDDHRSDSGSVLTGRHPIVSPSIVIQGPSIENYIGRKLNDMTPIAQRQIFPSYYLGVNTSTFQAMFGSGASKPILPRNDPMQAYAELFAKVGSGPPSAMPTADPAVAKLMARRKSILDLVKGELSAVRCQLGAEEKFKFDAHMSSIQAVEQSLTAGPGSGITMSCGRPTITGGDFPAMCKAQIDNAVAALACDVTRVMVVQLEKNASKMNHAPWAGAGISGGHHDMAHSKNQVALGLIDTWYAKQFFYMIDKMNKIPTSNGKTLLDDSAVIWVHEQGRGESHMRYDHGVTIAGSLGGYFKTNQMIYFDNGMTRTVPTNMGTMQVPVGEPLVRLWQNVAEAMGTPFSPNTPFDETNWSAKEKGFFTGGPLPQVKA
jgi:hypothetical protein